MKGRLFLIRLPKGRNVVMLQNIDNGYPFQECPQCAHVEVCRHIDNLMELKVEGLLPIDLHTVDCQDYLEVSRINLKESPVETGCTGCNREVAEIGIGGATRVSCGCEDCNICSGIPTDGESTDTIFGAFLKSLYLSGVGRLEQKLSDSSGPMTEPKPCNLGADIAQGLGKDIKPKDIKNDKTGTVDRDSVNKLVSSLIKDILGAPSSPVPGSVAYCGTMYETLVSTCKEYVAKGYKPTILKISTASLERLCKEAGIPEYQGVILSQMAVCQGINLQVDTDDNMEPGMFAIGITG